MLEIPAEMLIPFAIAASGTLVAGLWDLFTTEVPDEVSVLMIVSSLLYWFFFWAVSGNYLPLLASLLIGTAVFAVGWLLYLKGQWGGADALVLAAIFYAIPVYPLATVLSLSSLLFLFNFLINIVIVSLAYMVIYTVILGIKHRSIIKHFVADVSKTWKIIVLVPVVLTAAMTTLLFVVSSVIIVQWWIAIFVLLIMLFWRYAVVVETKHFTRTVSVNELKEGDVLQSSKKWVGVTKDDIKRLHEKHVTSVVVREGIRFSPVFFLAFAATFAFGNVLFYFFLPVL